MEFRRQQYQQAQRTASPGWLLVCAILVLALCLAALPGMLIGFLAQRLTARWLHWRLSFLIWSLLFFGSAFLLYTSYQHGLYGLINQELTDYILAARHYQLDLASYPLRRLWAETWPVWLHTWQGFGIAGFVGELSTPRADTTRTLRQHEQRRIQRAQRFQHRARKHASRPAHIPDEIGGLMVIGVPIRDDEED